MSLSEADRRIVGAALAKAAGLSEQAPDAAIGELREVLSRDPGNAEGIRLLQASLRVLGHTDWQGRADKMIRSLERPQLIEAARLLEDGKVGPAERVLRPYLAANPRDVSAIRLMADLARRIGRIEDSEKLLRQAIAFDPDYLDARLELSSLLAAQLKLEESTAQLEEVLTRRPDSAEYLILLSSNLQRLGRLDEAIATLERALALDPDDPTSWTRYGYALRTIGRLVDSIAAYRRALDMAPRTGTAWWSLANLKTVTLDDADIAKMIAALSDEGLSNDERLHLHFALGKGIEDQGAVREAFTHYSEANRLRRRELKYDPRQITDLVEASRSMFDQKFFAERQGYGDPADDPVFVIGMPRAGSTLVEQILSSHPQVEGAGELHYIIGTAMGQGLARAEGNYPESLAQLDEARAADLGRDYLAKLQAHRRLGRKRVVDKNPNNWMHIPLIQMILPNARIIDIRRHPLGCGLSNFKQHFAQGQAFSYSLEHIGRYYRDYVTMLSHIDAVLPGRVHRVHYENLVEDTEAEVRRMLEYAGLLFDQACLRFYENERAVRTPSSEQVRRPINRSGMEQWQPFDPWLAPLKTALGPVLDAYPEVPPL